MAERVNGLPAFITFTGVDNRVSLDEMAELSAQYPIEWAILLSASRQGQQPRYPSEETLSDFLWAAELRKACHLCGAYARDIMERRRIKTPADFNYFERVQVNHTKPKPELAAEFGRGWGVRCIIQSRSAEGFPTYSDCVDWLFDASGGRGIAPAAWPAHPGGNRLVGYAGGIGLENVASVVEAVRGSGPYWIDMESGVRTDDWLDLKKCRAVCETVYG